MEKDNFKQIRRMILIRVLMPPLIVILMVSGTLVYYLASYSTNQVKAEQVRVATDHRNLIDQFLGEKVADLQFIASAYSIVELKDATHLTRIFRILQRSSNAFFDLGIFDESANHLAYAGPYDLAGRNYAETEWFKAVQKKGLFISDVFLGYRNIPHFIIAVRRVEDSQTWYLRATIDTFAFNDLVESIRIGETGEAYLVNRQGALQSRRRSGGTLMEIDPDFKNYRIDDGKITSFSSFSRGPTGKRYLYSAKSLKQIGWIMVVRQAAGDAYGHLIFAVIVAIIMIIGGGIVVFLMGYLLASGLVNKLNLADVEKQQMKTQLVIAGKLAEVGEMSTGLAHEINNPLQVMKSELTMINDIIPDVAEIFQKDNPENFRLLTDSVNQIGIQIDRCGKITQGLLKFARKTDGSMQQIEMQKFLPEVVRMVEQRAYLENIRIVQELNPDIPPIKSDLNQLQQVFLNLLNNAIYALKGREPAEIRIQCSQQGEDITVSIADNGCGISPEDMEKIYLPFFTTKPVGQGTGLGLSTVYGIINGLGGELTVESEINSGTTFTVRLPLEVHDA